MEYQIVFFLEDEHKASIFREDLEELTEVYEDKSYSYQMPAMTEDLFELLNIDYPGGESTFRVEETEIGNNFVFVVKLSSFFPKNEVELRRATQNMRNRSQFDAVILDKVDVNYSVQDEATLRAECPF